MADYRLKSCASCGAHFTPKSNSHELCLGCWLWHRVGRNIRTNLLMIRKAKGA